MEYWSGINEERFAAGPYDTREEAIKEAVNEFGLAIGDFFYTCAASYTCGTEFGPCADRIVDPEDCLDTEPPPVRPERVCRGRVDWVDSEDIDSCADDAWICAACRSLVTDDTDVIADPLVPEVTCANGCHWSECGRMVGCDRVPDRIEVVPEPTWWVAVDVECHEVQRCSPAT